MFHARAPGSPVGDLDFGHDHDPKSLWESAATYLTLPLGSSPLKTDAILYSRCHHREAEGEAPTVCLYRSSVSEGSKSGLFLWLNVKSERDIRKPITSNYRLKRSGSERFLRPSQDNVNRTMIDHLQPGKPFS